MSVFYSFQKICLLSAALGLVACASDRPVETSLDDSNASGVAADSVVVSPVIEPYSMLDVARAMSRGAVDIYDPKVTNFANVVRPAPLPDSLAMFPVHPTMVVRDRHVRVYSLASRVVNPSESFESVLNTVRTGESDGGAMRPVPIAPVEVFTP